MGADAEVVGDGAAGEEVTFGSVVSLVVGGAGRPGGDVARGAGQGGSRELAASSRNCPMASSRVPAGRPARTCARSGGRRSSSFHQMAVERAPDCP